MSSANAAPSLLSVIVPCYNEELVLPETHAQLCAALGEIPGIDYELIYVDDGSSDGTFECLRRFQSESAQVRVLKLSRNFGQEVAMTAGLAECAGDAAVLFDADLQDPPATIAELVAHWQGGADVAYAVRLARPGETRLRLSFSTFFYSLINRIAERPIPREASDFRLLDRKVVGAFLAMPERDRFTRAMVSWLGFRQVAVHYRRQPRHAGNSKYRFGKRLRGAIDGLLSFSLLPLRLATWLGFLAAGAAVIGIAYAMVVRLFTDAWVSGWAGLLIAILFFGGIQLVVVGILGEYVGRIYGEVKRRPLYFVESRLGFPERSEAATKLTGSSPASPTDS